MLQLLLRLLHRLLRFNPRETSLLPLPQLLLLMLPLPSVRLLLWLLLRFSLVPGRTTPFRHHLNGLLLQLLLVLRLRVWLVLWLPRRSS